MKRSIALTMALLFLLSLAIPAYADGIGDNMAELGFAFLLGESVEQNYEKALEYLTEADKYGNTTVQFSIGEMYEYGLGVEADLVEAVRWYLKAAELGSREALEKLETEPLKSIARAMNVQSQQTTQTYSSPEAQSSQIPDLPQNTNQNMNTDSQTEEAPVPGPGSSNNPDPEKQNEEHQDARQDEHHNESLEYYLDAAERGDASAMFTLGEMYENGTGVEQNLVEAVKWYIKAAEAGNLDAQEKLEIEPMRSIAEALSVQEQATYVDTETGEMETIPRKGPVYPIYLKKRPVVDATGITILVIIDLISGIFPDDWYLYVKDENNRWDHVAVFEITEAQKKGQPIVCKLKLDGEETFTAIALNPVYPGMDFNASFETYLFVSESDLGEYGKDVPWPEYTPAAEGTSMSISRRPETVSSPNNLMGYLEDAYAIVDSIYY